MQRVIDGKNGTIYEMEEKIKELKENNREMIRSVDMSTRRFEEIKAERMYMQGQLNVLKRISGLYPEEIKTHDEWLKLGKEILSEIDIPF